MKSRMPGIIRSTSSAKTSAWRPCAPAVLRPYHATTALRSVSRIVVSLVRLVASVSNATGRPALAGAMPLAAASCRTCYSLPASTAADDA
jgi:hypothetical protein